MNSQPARVTQCDEKMEWWHYLCHKKNNFGYVFNNCQRTIPGWLTLFYMSPFSQKFKMAAICTSNYANNHISLSITMQIVNVIYGWTRMFWESRNLNITKQETFETFFAILIVKDYFKPTVVMYNFMLLYWVCTFVMSIRNTYMDNIHNCIVYMLSYYHFNSNPLSLKF